MKEYLQELQLQGIELFLQDGTLKFSAPKGVMTAPVMERLKRHKIELINYLQTQQASTFLIQPLAADQAPELSFAQQRIWASGQLMGDDKVYRELSVFRLCGKLQTAALQAAFQLLVERHKILQYRIVEDGLKPVLQHSADNQIRLSTEHYLGSLEEKQAFIDAQLLAHRRQPMDLSKDPLLNVQVIQLTDTEHVLSIVTHHLIGDAWSEQLMLDELAQAYNALCQQRPPELSVLPIQYMDFSAWQKQQHSKDHYRGQLDYWRKQLQGVPELHNLPTDWPRPVQPGHIAATYVSRVDDELGKQLQRFTVELGITSFAVLQTCLASVLAIYGQQSDVVMGTPVSGRYGAETERLLGMFVNNVVLRTEVLAQRSFREQLKANFATILAALEHQAVPFELVLEQANLERSLSYSPLFQIMFAMRNVAQAKTSWRDLTVQPQRQNQRYAKYELLLIAEPCGQGFELIWEYNRELFDPVTIKRFAASFMQLLQQGLMNPHQSLGELLLTDLGCVRHKTSQMTHRGQLLAQLEQWAKGEHRDAIAVTCHDKCLTYSQLMQLSTGIQHALAVKGIKAGDRVAVSLERGIAILPCLLAIMTMGAVYVPIDPNLPAKRIAYILEDSQSRLWISTGLAEFAVKTALLDPATLMSIANSVSSENTPAVASELAYLLYTSGTTGQPKGVEVSHHSLTNFVVGVVDQLRLDQQVRLLAVIPFSFDMSVFELLAPLYAGGTVTIADESQCADPQLLKALLDNGQFNLLQATPSRWQMLLTCGWQGQPNLTAICGGEALSAELARSLLSKVAQVWNGYGPTEATVYTLLHQLSPAMDDLQLTRLGGLLPGYGYAICQGNQLVPEGAVGELLLSGDGLARGYAGLPELSAEKFVELPIGRCYRSGDLVRHDSRGQLVYLGRIDHQVKIRGFRIELDEVTARLSQCRGVARCHVSFFAHQANPMIIAFATVIDGDPVDIQGLRHELAAYLPDYMVPAEIHLIKEFPLNHNGKIDGHKLLELRQFESVVTLPATAMELEMIDIWQEMLARAGIRPASNFFQVGGNSLLMVSLMGRLGHQFDIKLTLKEMYQHSSVTTLARLVEQKVNARQLLRHLTQDETKQKQEHSVKETNKLWI